MKLPRLAIPGCRRNGRRMPVQSLEKIKGLLIFVRMYVLTLCGFSDIPRSVKLGGVRVQQCDGNMIA